MQMCIRDRLKGASDTRNASANHAAEEDALKDKETPVLKKRLIASIGFLAVLMYFSMGHICLLYTSRCV